MARDHKMTLGGLPLRVAPEEMRWNFRMKTTDTAAVGGKVIQIIGLSMSDITLRGRFSPDRAEGDREAWEQGMRFREQIKALTKATTEDSAANPGVRLTYPPRGWDFRVHVKKVSPVEIRTDTLAMEWDLVLFPVGDGARSVVKGIKDLYIKRLMDGVGWKQTGYNGPTQLEVDEELGGRTIADYMAERTGEALLGGMSDLGSLWGS